MADAAWLAELMEHGLLRGSFVPPRAIRELRDLTRYRKRLVHTHTSEGQRIAKILEDAGIKLDSVASDLLGVSGRAMLRALIAGRRDPQELCGAPAVGGRLPTGDGRPLRGLERDHRRDDHGRRLNRRLGQDVSSKPRLITPNHHIGQLGWLRFDNAMLTVPRGAAAVDTDLQVLRPNGPPTAGVPPPGAWARAECRSRATVIS